MPLNPVPAGLRPPQRRLVNDSRDVAKVTLTIPAGDSLEVSAAVADQLVGQSNLREDDGSRAAELTEAITAEAEAREAQRLADEAARNGVALTEEPKPEPAKRARKASKKASPPADG
jgi:hypothetical protein